MSIAAAEAASHKTDPPIAGDAATNPRTSIPAAGTTAAELDAKLTPADRTALKDGQAQAQREADDARKLARRMGEDPNQMYRAVLSSYYEDHPVHVDTDDSVYAASYDEQGGKLTLQRNRERSGKSAAPAAPAGNTDGGLQPADSAAAAPAAGIVSSTTIVVDAQGGREATIRRAPSSTVDRADYLNEVSTSRSPSGSIVAIQESMLSTGITSDGTITKSREATDYTGDEVRSTSRSKWEQAPDGSVIATGNETTYGPGHVQLSERSTYEAQRAGATWKHEAVSTFEDGRRVQTTVDRSLDTGQRRDVLMPLLGFKIGDEPATGTSHYELTYGERSRLDRVTGTEPVDGRDPLEVLATQVLGQPSPGEQRPAFGPVQLSTEDAEVNGRTYHYPGLVADPGIATSIDGRPVFIESTSKRWVGDTATKLAKLREALAGAPEVLDKGAERFDMLEGRAPSDAYWTALYGNDFTAVASASGKGISFWNGGDPDSSTLYHELGHGSYDTGRGAPSEDTWRGAMAADQQLGVPRSVAKQGHILTSLGPLLDDDIGITSYAEMAYGEGRNMGEDWAESISMYVQSRQAGGLVEVRDDQGNRTTKQFEDLYPNRAKLLDAYYHVTSETSLAEQPRPLPQQQPTTTPAANTPVTVAASPPATPAKVGAPQ